MHGTEEPASYTQELIEMLECSDPTHTGCRERANAMFERLPPSTQTSIRHKREGKERELRTELEWERRKAAGMTVGGDRYRAMVDEIQRKYVPK